MCLGIWGVLFHLLVVSFFIVFLHGIDLLGIDCTDSPVDMIRLEEIVRARNIVQHPDFIGSNTVSFTDNDLQVLREPFFTSESNRQMSKSFGSEERWLFPLNLHISPEKFEVALNDIIRFAAWLDEKIYKVMGWNQPNRSIPR